jgi:hypothetical protein
MTMEYEKKIGRWINREKFDEMSLFATATEFQVMNIFTTFATWTRRSWFFHLRDRVLASSGGKRLRYVIWPTWKESKFTRRIELICDMDSPLNRRFARAGVGLHLSSMKWNIQNSIRKGKQDKGVQKNWIELNLQIS